MAQSRRRTGTGSLQVRALRAGGSLSTRIGDREVPLRHRLSQRQVDMVLAGGRIPLTAQAV